MYQILNKNFMKTENQTLNVKLALTSEEKQIIDMHIEYCAFVSKIIENICSDFQKPLPLCSDFFIVLELPVRKIGSQAWLPFAFYGGMVLLFLSQRIPSLCLKFYFSSVSAYQIAP